MHEQLSQEEYYELLVSMKSEINQYFDHTMVMAEDEAIKQNRLNQMAAFCAINKEVC